MSLQKLHFEKQLQKTVHCTLTVWKKILIISSIWIQMWVITALKPFTGPTQMDMCYLPAAVARVPHPDYEEKERRRGNRAVFILVYLSLSLFPSCSCNSHTQRPFKTSVGTVKKKKIILVTLAFTRSCTVSPLQQLFTLITLDSVTKASWHLSGNFLLQTMREIFHSFIRLHGRYAHTNTSGESEVLPYIIMVH